MVDHKSEIHPKTPTDTGKIKPLPSRDLLVKDDLALLKQPIEDDTDFKIQKVNIGDMGYKSLIDSLIERRVEFNGIALRDLEKVQDGQVQDIRKMGVRLGRKDILIGEAFGKGSFAFRLDNGQVQFAEDLKQLAAYLQEKKGFEISEIGLDKQLLKGQTVNSGGQEIKIELLGANDALQQLQEEVALLGLDRVNADNQLLEADDSPILRDGKPIKIERVTELGEKFRLLNDLEKQRTDNIKKYHQFIYGQVPKGNLAGFDL